MPPPTCNTSDNSRNEQMNKTNETKKQLMWVGLCQSFFFKNSIHASSHVRKKIMGRDGAKESTWAMLSYGKRYHVQTINVGCAVASFMDDSTRLICGRRAQLSIGSPFDKALANYVFYLDPKFRLPAGRKHHVWICLFSTYSVLNFYVRVVAWLLIACRV